MLTSIAHKDTVAHIQHFIKDYPVTTTFRSRSGSSVPNPQLIQTLNSLNQDVKVNKSESNIVLDISKAMNRNYFDEDGGSYEYTKDNKTLTLQVYSTQISNGPDGRVHAVKISFPIEQYYFHFC